MRGVVAGSRAAAPSWAPSWAKNRVFAHDVRGKQWRKHHIGFSPRISAESNSGSDAGVSGPRAVPPAFHTPAKTLVEDFATGSGMMESSAAAGTATDGRPTTSTTADAPPWLAAVVDAAAVCKRGLAANQVLDIKQPDLHVVPHGQSAPVCSAPAPPQGAPAPPRHS